MQQSELTDSGDLREHGESASEEIVSELRSGEGTEEISRQWGQALAFPMPVARFLTIFIRSPQLEVSSF